MAMGNVLGLLLNRNVSVRIHTWANCASCEDARETAQIMAYATS